MRLCVAALLLCSLLVPAPAQADQAQAARVAAISYAQTDKHFADPLIVEPVAVSGGYALADWVAGLKSGQVLLAHHNGKWRVIALENSALADARFLRVRYGVPSATAAALVRSLLAAEKLEGGGRP